MAKAFKFRLQPVLDLRAREEDEQKQIFGDARRRRLECEAEMVALNQERLKLLVGAGSSLEARLNLENRMLALDDREADQQVIMGVLMDEERAAQEAWLQARRNLQAMEKLRENRLDEWTAEVARVEQIEMDDWATMRRTA